VEAGSPAFLLADTVQDGGVAGTDNASLDGERDPSSTPSPGEREPMVLSTEPPPVKSSSLRAVSVLMVLAAISLGGYATWLYVLHPPGKPALRPTGPLPTVSVAATQRAQKAEPKLADTEDEPYAKKLAEAQELLKTDPQRAVDAFKAAFADGNMPAARSLLSHAAVAVEEKGKCRLTASAARAPSRSIPRCPDRAWRSRRRGRWSAGSTTIKTRAAGRCSRCCSTRRCGASRCRWT
jgi:hypothetical protein